MAGAAKKLFKDSLNSSNASLFASFFEKGLLLTIAVAALGYFVDIYDMLLLSMVRVASLKELGIPEDQLLSKGVFLINMQMGGMLLGGLLWGVLGDKRGRLSVLFGSIFLYSIANIANGFVHSVETYGVWRFLAGIGLAGELGAGITLVTEIMSKENRGYGTSIVASVGILGGVFGGLVADYFHWRTAYIIGGVMGFALLALRFGVAESGMFRQVQKKSISRGNFFLLFKSKTMLKRYLSVVLVGTPIWYLIGVLIYFSPEFGRAIGMFDVPKASQAVLFYYFGSFVGDLASGLLSQWLQSRKKVIFIFLLMCLPLVGIYLFGRGYTLREFYSICFILGIAGGYWAMFVTVAAEQFGTNIRATVATTAPNFVRGATIPLTMAFRALMGPMGTIWSAIAIGTVAFAIAFISLATLSETFGKDLDYIEDA